MFLFSQIFDGSRLRSGITNELGKYCSTSTPPPILSSGPVATLHFHSDSSMDDTGFSIAWSVEQGIVVLD
jgi:cubilin